MTFMSRIKTVTRWKKCNAWKKTFFLGSQRFSVIQGWLHERETEPFLEGWARCDVHGGRNIFWANWMNLLRWWLLTVGLSDCCQRPTCTGWWWMFLGTRWTMIMIAMNNECYWSQGGRGGWGVPVRHSLLSWARGWRQHQKRHQRVLTPYDCPRLQTAIWEGGKIVILTNITFIWKGDRYHRNSARVQSWHCDGTHPWLPQARWEIQS